MCVFVSGGCGGGYSEFCLPHRLGLFLVGFRLLNFTIFWGVGEKWLFLGYWPFACIFWGSLSKLTNSQYFLGIVRLGLEPSVEQIVVFI